MGCITPPESLTWGPAGHAWKTSERRHPGGNLTDPWTTWISRCCVQSSLRISVTPQKELVSIVSVIGLPSVAGFSGGFVWVICFLAELPSLLNKIPRYSNFVAWGRKCISDNTISIKWHFCAPPVSSDIYTDGICNFLHIWPKSHYKFSCIRCTFYYVTESVI